MSLARGDPFLDVSSLQDRMNRLIRDFWRDREEGPQGTLAAPSFAPPMDVYEDENHLTVEMEIPGIDQKDLNIRLDGNQLTVSGERRFEKEEKGKDFRRIERQYGSFNRSLTLPASVDPNSANANYENGVLRIQFSKRAEAKPRQIPIGAGKAIAGEKGKAA